VLALKPGLEEAGNILISAHEALGRFEEAAAIMSRQRCWSLAVDGAAVLDAYRRGGAEAYWRERLAQMERNTAAPPPTSYAFARCHAQIGNLQKAIDYVERMVEHHVGGCVFIGIDGTLSKLRGIPRYDALVSRVGAPLPQTV
jgi:hypothetical protein